MVDGKTSVECCRMRIEEAIWGEGLSYSADGGGIGWTWVWLLFAVRKQARPTRPVMPAGDVGSGMWLVLHQVWNVREASINLKIHKRPDGEYIGNSVILCLQSF